MNVCVHLGRNMCWLIAIILCESSFIVYITLLFFLFSTILHNKAHRVSRRYCFHFNLCSAIIYVYTQISCSAIGYNGICYEIQFFHIFIESSLLIWLKILFNLSYYNNLFYISMFYSFTALYVKDHLMLVTS